MSLISLDASDDEIYCITEDLTPEEIQAFEQTFFALKKCLENFAILGILEKIILLDIITSPDHKFELQEYLQEKRLDTLVTTIGSISHHQLLSELKVKLTKHTTLMNISEAKALVEEAYIYCKEALPPKA